MRKISIQTYNNLLKEGFPHLVLPPTIEQVTSWISSNFHYYIYLKHKDNFCYRFYSVEDGKETQLKGCRTRHGYLTEEDALEAAINKLLVWKNK